MIKNGCLGTLKNAFDIFSIALNFQDIYTFELFSVFLNRTVHVLETSLRWTFPDRAAGSSITKTWTTVWPRQSDPPTRTGAPTSGGRSTPAKWITSWQTPRRPSTGHSPGFTRASVGSWPKRFFLHIILMGKRKIINIFKLC